MRLAVLAIGIVVSSTVAACSDATGEAKGGDLLFDADAPIDTTPHDAGSGSTFSELYRDYFGPTGQASCTSGADCHLTPDQSGAQAIGFVCGKSKDDCYTSMIGTLVPPGGTPAGAKLPAQSTVLYQNLRKVPPLSPQGTMPRGSSFAFSSGDLQRIVDWMNAGAKNDGPAPVDAGADAAPTDAGKDAAPPKDAGADAASDAAAD